ncbi:hypothetical protein PENSPDRAFT_61244 [Peniophora sp. CONT]|nr:hypothetical protein PENSPDRAFT_61244 [Peniophora sp. CONT]
MADMPVLPPGTPLVDIHNTFGAIFIGCLASMTLLGMTLMQAWFYYQHFPEDPLWLKLVVVGTCVTEFLRSTFTANTVYYYLVQNWGNPNGLPVIVWSFSTIVLMTNLGELFGHFYFAWRIYMLSPRGKLRYTLSGLVVFFTLWNFGMGVSNYVALARASSLTAYAGGSQVVLAPLALATAISTDVSIAASLIFVLNRSRTGFSKTNRLINTLIFYSVQVGAITVVADAVCIGTNLSTTRRFSSIISVYMPLSEIYMRTLYWPASTPEVQ